ncbi:hypothetical protein SCOCK_140109 [Actinacidiphila cocklensis]|uniref:Uncharacterized protein n=1 Tax=Actinacidiphila cocklensis TaxID=887465 RepID=A0A9W4DQY2_9ACTN|nr:hypothetical protein SCOCK_140109 [Actinacidiphila cocklensis]
MTTCCPAFGPSRAADGIVSAMTIERGVRPATLALAGPPPVSAVPDAGGGGPGDGYERLEGCGAAFRRADRDDLMHAATRTAAPRWSAPGRATGRTAFWARTASCSPSTTSRTPLPACARRGAGPGPAACAAGPGPPGPLRAGRPWCSARRHP